MSEVTKIIRVTYTLVREFEPDGEHDFLFEGMTEKEIKKECLRFARQDLAGADRESFNEEIIEIVEKG